MGFDSWAVRVGDDAHGRRGLSCYRPSGCDLDGMGINRCGSFRNALLQEHFPCEQDWVGLKATLHRSVDKQVGQG